MYSLRYPPALACSSRASRLHSTIWPRKSPKDRFAFLRRPRIPFSVSSFRVVQMLKLWNPFVSEPEPPMMCIGRWSVPGAHTRDLRGYPGMERPHLCNRAFVVDGMSCHGRGVLFAMQPCLRRFVASSLRQWRGLLCLRDTGRLEIHRVLNSLDSHCSKHPIRRTSAISWTGKRLVLIDHQLPMCITMSSTLVDHDELQKCIITSSYHNVYQTRFITP